MHIKKTEFTLGTIECGMVHKSWVLITVGVSVLGSLTWGLSNERHGTCYVSPSIVLVSSSPPVSQSLSTLVGGRGGGWEGGGSLSLRSAFEIFLLGVLPSGDLLRLRHGLCFALCGAA